MKWTKEAQFKDKLKSAIGDYLSTDELISEETHSKAYRILKEVLVLGDDCYKKLLNRIYNHRDPKERIRACTIFLELDKKSVLHVQDIALKAPDKENRISALNELSPILQEITIVRVASTDPDPEVRGTALKKLELRKYQSLVRSSFLDTALDQEIRAECYLKLNYTQSEALIFSHFDYFLPGKWEGKALRLIREKIISMQKKWTVHLADYLCGNLKSNQLDGLSTDVDQNVEFLKKIIDSNSLFIDESGNFDYFEKVFEILNPIITDQEWEKWIKQYQNDYSALSIFIKDLPYRESRIELYHALLRKKLIQIDNARLGSLVEERKINDVRNFCQQKVTKEWFVALVKELSKENISSNYALEILRKFNEFKLYSRFDGKMEKLLEKILLGRHASPFDIQDIKLEALKLYKSYLLSKS